MDEQKYSDPPNAVCQNIVYSLGPSNPVEAHPGEHKEPNQMTTLTVRVNSFPEKLYEKKEDILHDF